MELSDIHIHTKRKVTKKLLKKKKKLVKMDLLEDLKMSLLNFNFVMI